MVWLASFWSYCLMTYQGPSNFLYCCLRPKAKDLVITRVVVIVVAVVLGFFV